MANWQQQADHGVTTLIEPDGSAIWNLRHHTINQFESKTGRLVRRVEFQSGGQIRRNYGPSLLGTSADGQPLLVATSQFVQHHLNVFTRSLDKPPVQRLDRWLGEVYVTHGVWSQFPASGQGDVDGDGGLDVVYSLRTAEPNSHTRTVACDLGSGRERTLDDTWLVGLVDLDGDGRKEIFAYDDPKANMPPWGTLGVYRFDAGGQLKLIGRYPETELMLRPLAAIEQPSWAAWGTSHWETPAAVELAANGRAVFLRDRRTRSVRQLTLREGKLVESPAPKVLADAEIIAAGRFAPEGPASFVLELPSGHAALAGPDGQVRCELPLCGGPVPEVTAADLAGDGHCQLAIRTPTGQAQIVSVAPDGKPTFGWSSPLGPIYQLLQTALPLRDLDGDGRTDVVTTGTTPDGYFSIRLLSGKGKVIWETPLPMPASGTVTRTIVGDFFGPGRAGVFVSAEQEQAQENSHMLDGRTGRIVWSGELQKTPSGVRACNPLGIPTAVDIDGDGAEDLVLDYRDFGAILRGTDGSFLLPLQQMPSVPKGWCLAYNSFIPIHRPSDGALHLLVPSGHGGVGLLGVDMKTEVWTHKPYYDTPTRMAMIDVDGDGRVDVGYEEARDGWFVCRDLWSGQQKWRVKLDGRGYGPAISADFDGDGRGEFLIGNLCIGTGPDGKGMIRWRTPVAPSGWPLVADVDGDKIGELILPCSDGAVRIYKAKTGP